MQKKFGVKDSFCMGLIIDTNKNLIKEYFIDLVKRFDIDQSLLIFKNNELLYSNNSGQNVAAISNTSFSLRENLHKDIREIINVMSDIDETNNRLILIISDSNINLKTLYLYNKSRNRLVDHKFNIELIKADDYKIVGELFE